MARKPFASSADLGDKKETLEVLADGVYALTAEGDPNIGAIEAEDFVIAFEARATPRAARDWLQKLREHTDKPVKYLVLSHYHAVRVLGASAFEAESIISHEMTRFLIDERGKQDWDSEFGRMPRLFREPEGIPGLTHPDIVFNDRLVIPLGGDRGDLVLEYCGRGHTAGDICAWLPRHGILFAGDLVEAEAALYTGDAFHFDWSRDTLDKVKSYSADVLVGGRGATVHGREAVDAAIEQTRGFLTGMIEKVGEVHREQEPGEDRREGRECQEPDVAPRLPPAGCDPPDQARNPGSIDEEDRDQRRHMHRDLEEHPRQLDPQEGLADHEVAGAGDGKELGPSLNHTQKDRLPRAHPRPPPPRRPSAPASRPWAEARALPSRIRPSPRSSPEAPPGPSPSPPPSSPETTSL